MVNGKQHSVWFVPTGMNGLPQNVFLNFRLEFPKSDLTIYLPSRISEIFCQMVSTLYYCVITQIPSRTNHERGQSTTLSRASCVTVHLKQTGFSQ